MSTYTNEFHRGIYGRIASSDNGNTGLSVRVGFTEIMRNLIFVFSRNAEVVRMIEITCSYNDITSLMNNSLPTSVHRMYFERSVVLTLD
ncbi:hypothetical protein D3C75_1100620 [compost metagenome]